MMNVLGYRAARRVRVLCVLCALCFALLASALIVVLVAQASTVVTGSFGSAGTGAGQFGSASPTGLAVNKTSGNVYAVDTANNRVEEFSENGSFIRAFGWGIVASGPDKVTPASAVQSVNVPGTVTAGTFVLSFNGQSTGGTATGTLTAASKAVSGLVTAEGTGTLTSGSLNVTGVTTTIGKFIVGQPIAGTGIPTGAKITAVSGATLTLSAAATASGSPVTITSSGPLPFAVGETVTGTNIPAGTTITAVGAAGTGTLTLSANAEGSGAGVALTAGLPYNATAAQVQTALQGLASIGSADATVTGGPGASGTPFTVTFAGTLANTPVPTMTAESHLTGGSVPAPTTTTAGVSDFENCNVQANPTDVCQAATNQAGTVAGGANGAGAMNRPQGIAVDQANGNVYTTDMTNGRVDVFSAVGAFEGAFGWGVATHAGQLEFCATTCLAGLSGANAGELNTAEVGYPAVDPSTSQLVVADNGNARVDEFSPTIAAGVVTGASFVRAFGNSVVTSGPDHFNEITDVTVSASAGKFKLSFGGETTGELAYNVPASGGFGATASVQNALEALPAIGADNVKVAGGPGSETGTSPYGITFTGAFAGAAKGPITATSGAIPLSGGSATATVTTLNPGGAAGYEVCNVAANPSDVCKTGANSLAVGGFNGTSPSRVAVDSTGAVYALSAPGSGCNSSTTGLCRTQKFSAGGTAAAEFAPAQLKLESGSSSSVAPSNIAIGANNDLLVAKPNASPAELRVLELNPSGTEVVATHGVGNGLPAANGLAAVESSRLYLSTSTGDKVYILTPPPAPTVSISPVTNIGATTATFNGTVTPPPPIPYTGFDTTYHFEYSANGVTWTSIPASDVDVGSVNAPVAVHQSVSGLSPNTVYEVRLFATTGTPATSSQTGFTTAAAPPTVSNTVASPVTATTARLTGYVNPNNSPTSYHYEWGLTAAYGNQAPADFTPFIGSGGQPLPVPVSISGLQPATTYHFRLVASSPAGTTNGPDEEFTTLGAEGSCSNEALRAESALDPTTGAPYSTQLPDCRAYEQVTPELKDGANVSLNTTFSSTGVAAISRSGSPLTATSTSIWGSPAGAESVASISSGITYELVSSVSGWNVAALNPPASQLPFAALLIPSPLDTNMGIWEAAAPSQPLQADDLYLRETDGLFTRIGPVAPPSTATGAPRGVTPVPPEVRGALAVQGASRDLSDVLFSIKAPRTLTQASYLWPGDETSINVNEPPSLYEYAGAGHTGDGADVPSIVGVDNAGTQITQCGTALGAFTLGGKGTHNAVSAGGSTVFFNAQKGGCVSGAKGPAVQQLYARIGAPGAGRGLGDATTVNVAATGAGTPKECSSDQCGVSQAVTYNGASEDGTRVFFTTTGSLLPGDTDTTNDLYECKLPGDQGTPPARSASFVDPCPELTQISAGSADAGTPGSENANVQSVVAVAEDGSHVYFIATGALTGAPNRQGQTAQQGSDNLYVYEPDPANPGQYKTAFITTLPTASLAGAGAQATPDGDFLLFTSTGDLTPDDTSTVSQVFRYDARSEELLRLSVGQGGFNHDGNTTSAPATLGVLSEFAGVIQRGIMISEDGSYAVFQSNDALTPQVQGGVNNVYEWHDGNVSLISDGTDTESRTQAVGLIGMDESGANVFFTTLDRLVGQDTDASVDVYDAHIDGGFPAPVVAACTSTEGCPGPLTASLTPPLVGSTSAPAIGNTPPPVTQTSGTAGKIKITKHSVKGATVTLTVQAPGKGRLTVSGFGLKKITRSASKAGAYTLKVSLTVAEKRTLARKKIVRVTARVGFVPASGKASSDTITITVKT